MAKTIDFVNADIEEFIAMCAIRFCPVCGEKIELDRRHSVNGRPKKFCSAVCRNKFWKLHPKKDIWDSYEKKTCPICGKEFYAQKENKRSRKYCSRGCANKSRALKGEGNE